MLQLELLILLTGKVAMQMIGKINFTEISCLGIYTISSMFKILFPREKLQHEMFVEI